MFDDRVREPGSHGSVRAFLQDGTELRDLEARLQGMSLVGCCQTFGHRVAQRACVCGIDEPRAEPEGAALERRV